MTEYPEHEKLRAVAETSQHLGELIDLLHTKGYVVARWNAPESSYRARCLSCDHTEMNVVEERLVPVHGSINYILADLFDIDLVKIDAEKVAMIDALREMQKARS